MMVIITTDNLSLFKRDIYVFICIRCASIYMYTNAIGFICDLTIFFCLILPKDTLLPSLPQVLCPSLYSNKTYRNKNMS